MEHPIGTLPRTPFSASRDFPSRGNEKIGGTGYCVTYDTDSQSRNVLASFRGRGPRSGEGMYEGKNDYDILILCLIALKGKRLTIFCASLALRGPPIGGQENDRCHISAQPRTPFCLFEAFPLKGKRENRWHWILCHI